MRIAIIHDWLTNFGGAERVLAELVGLYPSADLFAVVDHMPDAERGFLQGRPVQTTFIQGLPFSRRHYRTYLPLMPLAIEQIDLSLYDLVISSSYAVAKGVITGPDQLHISYVHSPMRYAWDLTHQYLAESNLGRGIKAWTARYMLHKMRLWDLRTTNGVDAILANSQFIARRIRKIYGRSAAVIYPPVDVEKFELRVEKQDFYLIVSRLVPYKRVNLLVEAFNTMPDQHLVIVGHGPEFAHLRAKAGPNIELLGYQRDAVVRDLMQRAKAFVFAAEEDFGIVTVEAQACGTPVILYGKGGGLETVRGLDTPEPTGIFFPTQTSGAVIAAVEAFEATRHRFSAHHCRTNAMRFSADRFRREFENFVERNLRDHWISKQPGGWPALVPSKRGTA